MLYNCKKCNLYKERLHPVKGDGNKTPIAFLIGEAPGKYEDLSGKPFVGRSGVWLKELLGEHLKYVYMTNAVKCRPHNNRTPSDAEIRACSPYVIKQISLANPKIILCLGKVALNLFVNTSVSKARKSLYNYNGIILLSTFHPSAPNYYEGEQRKNIINAIVEDINKLKILINKLK
jgi:uracil-DNA glycosylase family 4